VTFEDVDGHGRVRFADDGTGMTRRTLEEVFFALGRTTKDGEDSIGGFGRARIILCFAPGRVHHPHRPAAGAGPGRRLHDHRGDRAPTRAASSSST
jgi:hypothetical protein